MNASACLAALLTISVQTEAPEVPGSGYLIGAAAEDEVRFGGGAMPVAPDRVVAPLALIAAAGPVVVLAPDGRLVLARRVIGADDELALVEVPGLRATPVELRAGPKLASGDRLRAVGSTPMQVTGPWPSGLVLEQRRDTWACALVIPYAGALIGDAAGSPRAMALSVRLKDGGAVVFAAPTSRLQAAARLSEGGRDLPQAKIPERVALPRIVGPPWSDRERLQKLSDDALAKGLDADPKTASLFIEDAMRWNPYASAPRVAWAQRLDEARDWVGAAIAHELAALLRPELSLDHCALSALNLHKAGRNVAAARVSRRCLEADDDHAVSHAVLGAARAAEGDYDEAEPHLRRALKLNPKLGWVRGIRAVALQNRGALEEAVREFQRAIKSAPKNAGLRVSLAEAFVAQKKLKRAVHAYGVAVKLAPDDGGVRARYAELLVAVGDKKRARRQAEAALASQPGEPRATKLLEELSSPRRR